MVCKCSVPRCTSSARVPSHALPADGRRAEAWLNAVGLSNMIDAPWEAKAKLRICGLHFCEEMVVQSGQRRRLKDNAMPTLHLLNTDVADNASISFTGTGAIAALESSQNVEANSLCEPRNCCEGQQFNVILNRRENVRQLRNKIRRYQKALHKKRRIINTQKKRRAEGTTAWDDITAEMTGVQKTFMEMITHNFHHAPQDNAIWNSTLLPTVSALLPLKDKCYEQGLNNPGKHIQIFQTTHNITISNVREKGHRYEAKQKALALTLYKTMGKRAYTRLREMCGETPLEAHEARTA